jgi:hypothetical protein
MCILGPNFHADPDYSSAHGVRDGESVSSAVVAIFLVTLFIETYDSHTSQAVFHTSQPSKHTSHAFYNRDCIGTNILRHQGQVGTPWTLCTRFLRQSRLMGDPRDGSVSRKTAVDFWPVFFVFTWNLYIPFLEKSQSGLKVAQSGSVFCPASSGWNARSLYIWGCEKCLRVPKCRKMFCEKRQKYHLHRTLLFRQFVASCLVFAGVILSFLKLGH